MMTDNEVRAQRAKPKGHEFIAFISGPFDATASAQVPGT
jgi:hypothetical protein